MNNEWMIDQERAERVKVVRLDSCVITIRRPLLPENEVEKRALRVLEHLTFAERRDTI